MGMTTTHKKQLHDILQIRLTNHMEPSHKQNYIEFVWTIMDALVPWSYKEGKDRDPYYGYRLGMAWDTTWSNWTSSIHYDPSDPYAVAPWILNPLDPADEKKREDTIKDILKRILNANELDASDPSLHTLAIIMSELPGKIETLKQKIIELLRALEDAIKIYLDYDVIDSKTVI